MLIRSNGVTLSALTRRCAPWDGSRIKWQQMRGNIKWDLLKLAGASVITAAYLLLQKLRHLSLDWPVAGGLFAVSLVAFLYLGKAKKNRDQSSGTQSTALSTTLNAFDATVFFQQAYNSSLQPDIEKNIRAAATQNQPTDREGFLVKVIGIGLISYTYDITWAYIFRSQLLLLMELNRKLLSLTDAKIYYDKAATDNPIQYAGYSFQSWLSFMKTQVLIIHHPSDMVEITVRGQDFLKYLTHWGRYPDDRNL